MNTERNSTLYKMGARLARTGLWNQTKARAWCTSQQLTFAQTDTVLCGFRDEARLVKRHGAEQRHGRKLGGQLEQRR